MQLNESLILFFVDIVLGYIPQAAGCAVCLFTIADQRLRSRPFLITTVIYAAIAMAIRLLYNIGFIDFGFHTIIIWMIFIIVAILYNKLPVMQSTVSILVSGILITVSEIITAIVLSAIFGAERFNAIHPGTFTVPEPIMAKTGMKIMSLAEPTKKMSKSDENPNAIVYILEDRDTIIRKFKRAVTDSDTCVRFAEGKDGINNLMSIYSCFTGKDFAEIEREFDGRGYGDFKLAVGEVCADALAPVQKRHAELLADKAYLEATMKKGAEEAAYYARKTLSKVQKKLGFVML